MLEGLIARSRDPQRRAEYEAELRCPPLPPELAYLWRAFMRIRRRTGGSGFGVGPITWGDIDAFVRNSRLALLPWEIEIVEDLDDLFVTEKNKPADKGG